MEIKLQQKQRFADLTNQQIDTILESKDAVNTKRSTNTAVKLFRKYLAEKSLPLDLEQYSVVQLDQTLSKFYAEARNESGSLYKKSSLQTIRYGINRHINSEHTDKLDILKDVCFKESNRVFSAVCKDLKRQGYGGTEHHPPIDDADLQKMYQLFDLNNPKHLQWKVFCDIMLYFGRRVRENLRELKISDFAATTDGDGFRYIYICKDELTKNHQDDTCTNSATGRMYEIRDGDQLCPVKTFVQYKRKLNPKCVFIFQRPSIKPKADIWYDNAPIGQNTLGSMMNAISKEFNLSKVYTNHSLRATSVHILDAAQFPGRHIMSVTGHKSETSLKTYTGYTDTKTKQKMSNAISGCLKVETVKPVTDNTTETINFDQLAQAELAPLTDSQLNELFSDKKDDDFDIFLTIDTSQISVSPTACNITQSTSNSKKSFNYNTPFPSVPVVNNYGTLHINYNFFQK